jgi:hypothetical protein
MVCLGVKDKLSQAFCAQLPYTEATVVRNFFFNQRDPMAALERRVKVSKIFHHLELFYLFADR